MFVTTVAIVAIVAFGVLAWTVIRDDTPTTGGDGGDWNRVAFVDRTSGDITVLNPDGSVDRTVVGRGRVDTVHAIGGRLAMIGPEQIVIDEVGAEPTIVAIDPTNTVTPVWTDGGLDLVIGEPAGGNVRILDVVTGRLIDVAALAGAAEPTMFQEPLMFAETLRWSADAQSWAVADASSFQTVVVSKESPTATFFPAQPVALGDDRVVTSQIVGGQADVELYDAERESKARVPLPIPAGGVMVDGDAVIVTVDGGVYRFGDGDTEAERLAQIAVPSGSSVIDVHPVLDGERLVIAGTAFEAVIELDGTTVFTTTFTEAIVPAAPAATWSCVPIGGDGVFHSIVALETGEQLADLSSVAVTGTSSDGCTVLADRDGTTEVTDATGTAAIGETRRATLGPDGRSLARVTSVGQTELVTIRDDLGLDEVIDVTDSVSRSALVAFLDS